MATVIAAVGAAGTGIAAASTLSTVFSVGSALASIGQGIAANNRAKEQAAWANVEAEQELQKGAEQARDLAKEYAALRSEQDMVMAANGIDLGVGTPVNIAKSTARIAQENLSKTRENARFRYRSARRRSRGLLQEGKAALIGGFGKAASIGAEAYQLTG